MSNQTKKPPMGGMGPGNRQLRHFDGKRNAAPL